MTNLGTNSIILIDFGLSYNTTKVSKSKPYSFKGTPFFASNNQLLKGQLGFKDDLESLMYVLIYFIMGGLPWQKHLPVLDEDIEAHIEV